MYLLLHIEKCNVNYISYCFVKYLGMGLKCIVIFLENNKHNEARSYYYAFLAYYCTQTVKYLFRHKRNFRYIKLKFYFISIRNYITFVLID